MRGPRALLPLGRRRRPTTAWRSLWALPVLVAKLAVGGFALAVIETILAKMRIFRVPEFLATAFLLGVLALLVHLLLGA